jgi:hypothetical protein
MTTVLYILALATVLGTTVTLGLFNMNGRFRWDRMPDCRKR